MLHSCKSVKQNLTHFFSHSQKFRQWPKTSPTTDNANLAQLENITTEQEEASVRALLGNKQLILR